MNQSTDWSSIMDFSPLQSKGYHQLVYTTCKFYFCWKSGFSQVQFFPVFLLEMLPAKVDYLLSTALSFCYWESGHHKAVDCWAPSNVELNREGRDWIPCHLGEPGGSDADRRHQLVFMQGVSLCLCSLEDDDPFISHG